VPTAIRRLFNRQHPVVREFRRLAVARASDDFVLLDGPHVIADALDASVPVRTLIYSDDFLARASAADRSIIDASARAGAAVFEAAASVVEAASPVRTSSGVVAIGEWRPAPIEAVFAGPRPLVIGLVDVQDPGNVGAAIRSADALEATGVVAIDHTAHPGNWKALRGSMGSAFRLAVARSSLEAALDAARRSSVRILATTPESVDTIESAPFTDALLMLVGNEGAGLPETVLREADVRVRIPMRHGVNSLNVAVTAALMLHEARRQRRARS
jgi:TrmH family RNA methyltransferase